MVFTRAGMMNKKGGLCKDLHPSFVVLSGWCLQLYRAGWKTGGFCCCCSTIGIMWQTCIRADKQPLHRGEIQTRTEVNNSERETQAGVISAGNTLSLTVMAETWSYLESSGKEKQKREPEHRCMTEIHPKFNSRQQKQTDTAKSVRKTRRCVSGNLSVCRIKNILLYSRFKTRRSQPKPPLSLSFLGSFEQGTNPKEHYSTFNWSSLKQGWETMGLRLSTEYLKAHRPFSLPRFEVMSS